MIHDLTIGHLDPAAIPNHLAAPLRPLDEATVARVLTKFPGLKVERRDGDLIAPWHGRGDTERGEAFAARMPTVTRCLVADRRNGRIVIRSDELRRRVVKWDSEVPIETFRQVKHRLMTAFRTLTGTGRTLIPEPDRRTQEQRLAPSLTIFRSVETPGRKSERALRRRS